MDILLPYTAQLFYFPKFTTKNDIGELMPEPAATGVLLDIKGQHFIVTAKHVFADTRLDDFAILATDVLISLGGEMAFYQLTNNDTVDIALILIPPDRAEAIKKTYQFLPWQNLAFNHTFSEDALYGFLGFINAQTTRNGNSLDCKPFGFRTTLKAGTRLENYGFSSLENIMLKYETGHQRIEDAPHSNIGPKSLKGLSGCGIWHIAKNDDAKLRVYSLVGVLIEERMDKGFLVGTQISMILRLLREYFRMTL